jgi:hypothetical protein
MTQAVSGVSVFERMEGRLFGIFAAFTLLAIIGQGRRFLSNSFADVRPSCYFRHVLGLLWREFYEACRPWFSRPFRLDRSRRAIA